MSHTEKTIARPQLFGGPLDGLRVEIGADEDKYGVIGIAKGITTARCDADFIATYGGVTCEGDASSKEDLIVYRKSKTGRWEHER